MAEAGGEIVLKTCSPDVALCIFGLPFAFIHAFSQRLFLLVLRVTWN